METMFVAVPTADGMVCRHFGHCTEITLIRVDDGRIGGAETVIPPPHEPGVLPAWLGELGVTHVLAGGMGQRAQALLGEKGITVWAGVEPMTPELAVEAYLAGRLAAGDNPCDH